MARRKTTRKPKASLPLREPPPDAIRLVGIDCATLAEKTGLAVGALDPASGAVFVTAARCCAKGDQLAALVADAIGAGPALLALDAPLGWPAPLGDTLSWHQAGAPFGSPVLPDDRMFSRATDLEIRARFGKRPLEVGADRIARTARAALRLLADIEARRSAAVPLAWTPGTIEGVCAIEVYPAATLRGHGIPHDGYRLQAKPRRSVLEALRVGVALPPSLARGAVDPHLLDAVLCVLAAADFATGNVRPPPLDQTALSRREGWIWARDPPTPVT